MRSFHIRCAIVVACAILSTGVAFAAGGSEESAEAGTTKLLIMQQFPVSFVQEDNPVIAFMENIIYGFISGVFRIFG